MTERLNIMVMLGNSGREVYDLSFMYSKECDLECPFCMYDSSPRVKDQIDLPKLRNFIESIDNDLINSYGLYGGEPTILADRYSKIIEMLPRDKPKFVITNGTWSKTEPATTAFLNWCSKYKLTAFVSGTPYHQKFQNKELIKALSAQYGFIILKKPDNNFLPMGKLKHLPAACSHLCMRNKKPVRIAVEPDGAIIFQTCDGVYPEIGTFEDKFRDIHERILQYSKTGFKNVCQYN